MLNSKDENGNTCLHEAVFHNRVKHVKSLCSVKLVNKNAANSFKNTALHIAVLNNYYSMVQTLVALKVDLLV